MPDSVSFTVAYDGTALENHEIDVKDLAPALLAMSDLFEETNEILNHGKAKVSLNIKGSFKSGSFEVDLHLLQSITTQAISFLSGEEATAVSNLIAYVGFLGGGGLLSGAGLLQLLRWQKNRPIKSVIELDDGKCRITVTDPSLKKDDHIDVMKKVVELFQNLRVRKSIETVIQKPLSKTGIESFIVKQDGKKEEFKKEESEYFKSPDYPEELLSEGDVEMSLQIVSISFVEGNKWRFSDGNASFFATVSDSEFLEKVRMNEESFSKDDILQVTLHKRQSITDGGMRTDYDVKKVLNHRSAAKQLKLPFIPKDGDFS